VVNSELCVNTVYIFLLNFYYGFYREPSCLTRVPEISIVYDESVIPSSVSVDEGDDGGGLLSVPL
jgi:hypothetical protein